MLENVCLSERRLDDIYVQAFETWTKLFSIIDKNLALPSFALRHAFPDQPSFPRGLRLHCKQVADENRVYARGESTWTAASVSCRYGLPSFNLPAEIEVAAKQATTVAVEAAEGDYFGDWFPGEQNFVAVLALAWAYILSARWAETMPGRCLVAYTRGPNTAQEEHSPSERSVVDIGDASAEEARWWSCILEQHQGWIATMDFGEETFLSLWSVRQESRVGLCLSVNTPRTPVLCPTAPCSTEASQYLARFCAHHRIGTQVSVALAAVLLFPCMGRGQSMRLPMSLVSNSDLAITSRRLGRERAAYFDDDTLVQDGHLDRLLTLSCYTRGIRPILFSVFYDPSVECNAAATWLQGSLTAIDRLTGRSSLALGCLLARRSPRVSFLWLGAIALGLEDDLLMEVRRGQLPIDLLSAAWSGTTQTFMQLPASGPYTCTVPRADECRLLYLSRSDDHTRLPLVQWKPFGSTPIEDTDIEVRKHVTCRSHRLVLGAFEWATDQTHTQAPTIPQRLSSGLTWLATLERHVVDLPFAHRWLGRGGEIATTTENVTLLETPDRGNTALSVNDIEHGIMAISENATRCIFSWLRPDGCTGREKDILGHEWFALSDSDSEDEFTESGHSPAPSSFIRKWMSHTVKD